MRALVTGANGFVGRHMVRHLLELGREVVAVAGPTGRQYSAHGNIVWDSVDLRKESDVFKLLREYRPDEIYHLAGVAVTHGVSFDKYFEGNVLVTRNVGQAALEVCGSSCRMLHVSSAGVYGDPEAPNVPISESSTVRPKNDYGVTKASAEMILWPLWHRGLDVRIVRPFNHTGPGQQLGFVCPDLVHRLKEALVIPQIPGDTLTLEVGRLDSVRDFTDVRDVVRAYVLIMERFGTGEVVNVASGEGHSIGEIVHILTHTIAGQTVNIHQDDALRDRVETDMVVGDNRLLVGTTGWRPQFTLEETLRDLWDEAVVRH